MLFVTTFFVRSEMPGSLKCVSFCEASSSKPPRVTFCAQGAGLETRFYRLLSAVLCRVGTRKPLNFMYIHGHGRRRVTRRPPDKGV